MGCDGVLLDGEEAGMGYGNGGVWRCRNEMLVRLLFVVVGVVGKVWLFEFFCVVVASYISRAVF
jgi:hypothetical protein